MVAYIDLGKTLNLDQRFVQGKEVRLVGVPVAIRFRS